MVTNYDEFDFHLFITNDKVSLCLTILILLFDSYSLIIAGHFIDNVVVPIGIIALIILAVVIVINDN